MRRLRILGANNSPSSGGWSMLLFTFLFAVAHCSDTTSIPHDLHGNGGAAHVAPPSPSLLRSTSNDACSTYFYARDCLQNSSCTFCCGAPIGQQCMSSIAASASCPLSQRIANTTVTCDDLCYAPQSLTSCEECVAMIWCYFCATNSSCMAAAGHCEHGRVLQTCGAAVLSGSSSSDDFNTNVWYRVVVYAAAGAAAILLLVALLIAAQRCHVRNMLRGILRPETAPLLPHPTSPNGASAMGDSAVTMVSRPGGAATVGGPAAANTGGEANAVATNDAPVAVNSEVSRRRGNGVGEEGDDGSVSSGSEKMCQLCYERDATILFLPCNHVHCCANCANKLRPSRQRLEITCPFCRQRISGMVKLDALHLKKSN